MNQCFNCGRLSMPPYQIYQNPSGDQIELCATCTATYRSGYGGYVQVLDDIDTSGDRQYELTLSKAEFILLSTILSSRLNDNYVPFSPEEEQLTKKLLTSLSAPKEVTS